MGKRFGLAVLLAVALLALGGCSGAQTKPTTTGTTTGAASGAASGGGSASAEDTAATAGAYSALTAESPNEQKAVASIGIALKSYISGLNASNKQNNTSTYVFTNEQGYKPLLIGYAFTLFTGKQANGTYGYAQVLVLGDKVTSMAQWERGAGVTRDNGLLNMKYFKLESPSDPLQFTKVFTPTSAAEKNAQARVTEWMSANAADLGFKDAKLTGYAFAYGQPGDHPNLLLIITPDGLSSMGTGTAP